MRHLTLLSGLLLATVSFSIAADEVPNSTTGSQGQSVSAPKETGQSKTAPVDSPEDRAYQEKMLQLSNAITQKISEVQAKQKELAEEIYPASKPPIQADLDVLNSQLDALKMQKEQLDSQKNASDMAKKLNDSTGSNPK